MKSRTQRGIFALAAVAALGFGGTQAFASPAAATEERACTSSAACRRDCIARGYDGGFCDMGGCMCIIQ